MRTRRCCGLAVVVALVASSALAQVAYDPVTNRSYVVVPTVQSWGAHRADAVLQGGDLASIGSQAENNLIDVIAGDAFIGFTDDTAFGGTEFGNTSANNYPTDAPPGDRGNGWVWTDGSPVTFQNWAAGEPNDVGGEDVGQIRAGGGQWNDLGTQTLPAVYEFSGLKPGALFNNHQYYLIPATQFATAESQAVAMGGHLVSIGSQAELDFVNGLYDSTLLIGLTDDPAYGGSEFGNTSGLAYPAPGNTPSSEPGTQRGEGWVWTDGSPLLFQAWNGGEPNNSGSENFVEMLNGSGLWNDNGNITQFAVVEIVPEPGSIALLALGIPMLLRRRRLARMRR